MKDDAVHIRVWFRDEGSLVKDGVNVTNRYSKYVSDFIFFRRGFKQLTVKIPKDTRWGRSKEYEAIEEEWDPRLKSYKSCVFDSDENT